MTSSAASLLKLLGSGVLQDGASALRPQPTNDLGIDFAELLRKAEAGEIGSGRPVSLAPRADVELTDAQLDRLAKAADAAEAAGATRALTLLDGQPLVLDVASRTVQGAMESLSSRIGDHSVLTGVDAAIVVATESEGGFITAPPGGIASGSLANLLERIGAGSTRG